MPKVKVLSRSEQQHTRETRQDVSRVHRNVGDASMHRFERAREYTRALNQTKLDKIFHKPFVAQLDGHRDGVWCTAANPRSLVKFVSGGCDGELRVWDLPTRQTVFSTVAHQGFVRGVSVGHEGRTFFSCGDTTVKQWPVAISGGAVEAAEPLRTFALPHQPMGMDCHWRTPTFATAGECLNVWAESRAEPLQSFADVTDGLISVKWNPAEPDILATTANDRAVCIYDTRAGGHAVRSVVLAMKSNALCWNPREPMNFTVANEDHNLYSFDMRKLQRASMVHVGHVGAVMSVSYSSTGHEFATASYDRSVRIFDAREGRSREVYHSKRMQRVFCINYTADAKYVVSGSDDANLRLWKAHASKSVARQAHRQRAKQEYGATLKNRFKNMREIRRIDKHRKVPKFIKKQAALAQVQKDSVRNKDERRRANGAKLGPRKPEREKAIVREME